MRMLGIIAYIMRFAVGGAIETVALASDVAICHRTILQAGNIRCQFLAVHHQTAQIFVGAGVVGTSAVHPYTRVGGVRFYQGNLGLQINVIATIFLLFSAYSCRKVSKNDKFAAKSNIFWEFMLDIVEKVLTLQRI